MPRDLWYHAIKPLIWDINSKENGMTIVNSKKDHYPNIKFGDDSNYLGFNIDDLKKYSFDDFKNIGINQELAEAILKKINE